jgi:hypothetical protein
MSYVGNTPTTQSFIAGTDYFNGTGSATAFTLSRSVVSVNDIQAVVNNVVQVPNDAYTVSGTTITFTSAPSSGTSNIYVRYLSTTTQSITPSQNTVSYSTLNSDNQSKLGISFKNRIINGAMLVSQRNGTTATNVTTNAQYTLDRWTSEVSQSSKFTVTQSTTAPAGFNNSALITSSSAYTVGASEIFTFEQRIEAYNTADLGFGTANAKTVTLSFWVQSSLTGTFGGALQSYISNRSYPFSYTISAANTWQQVSITVPGDITGSWSGASNSGGIVVIFSLGAGSSVSGTAGAWSGTQYFSTTGATSVVGTSGATWYITGVQLEVGTQATTFDYRDIGRELMLCQRYFAKIGGTTSTETLANGMSTDLNTAQYYCVYFPVNMRAAPTATISNIGGSDLANGTAAATSIRGQLSGVNTCQLGLNTNSAGWLTAYRPMAILTTATAGNISLSAEL